MYKPALGPALYRDDYGVQAAVVVHVLGDTVNLVTWDCDGCPARKLGAKLLPGSEPPCYAGGNLVDDGEGVIHDAGKERGPEKVGLRSEGGEMGEGPSFRQQGETARESE